MEDKTSILVERIKTIIIEMIHYADELPKANYSVYLTEKVNLNYTYLANLFAEVTVTTIEHFIIIHKIEKVKELIIYDELDLTENCRTYAITELSGSTKIGKVIAMSLQVLTIILNIQDVKIKSSCY